MRWRAYVRARVGARVRPCVRVSVCVVVIGTAAAAPLCGGENRNMIEKSGRVLFVHIAAVEMYLCDSMYGRAMTKHISMYGTVWAVCMGMTVTSCQTSDCFTINGMCCAEG
jgi:hypothetical protein